MQEKITRDITADYDVIIIGTGPAGLQAAIHAARRKVSVLVLGRPGDSSLFKAHIENYCCVPGVKTGEELIHTGIEQARNLGADFLEEDVVSTAALADHTYQVVTESDNAYKAYALIIATGVSRKGLGLKGEKQLIGRGISYCIDCDANFFRDAAVAVAGDGSAAVHGAITLNRIAREVTLIAGELKISPSLERQLQETSVSVLTNTGIREIKGTDRLERIVLKDGTELALDGLFIEKGAKGAMELAAFLGVQLDPEKFTYIITDQEQATNIQGVFAAGDICGRPFQMAKAVGEGCIAGMSASSYVLKQRAAERK
ncbi:MAG TPA: FAD-binding protein [Thermodesulfobacteriaceae bacterium]|nr:FAD-binding protein [Thermodesulfobacteriaceae bacterium]